MHSQPSRLSVTHIVSSLQLAHALPRGCRPGLFQLSRWSYALESDCIVLGGREMSGSDQACVTKNTRRGSVAGLNARRAGG